MKLVQLSLTLAATIINSHSVYGQWNPDNSDCDGCLTNADEFQVCVQQFCMNTECLGAPPYTNVPSLASCCGMDSNCRDYADQMETCLDDCLPECIEESIRSYLECSDQSALTGTCNMEDCITRIALDRDFIDVGGNANEFFEELADDLENTGFTADCSSTVEKATLVCETGESCCNYCNPQLGMVMNCVVNVMIRPWQKTVVDNQSYDSNDDACEALTEGPNSQPGYRACGDMLARRQLNDVIVNVVAEGNKTTMDVVAEGNKTTTEVVVGDKAKDATAKCMGQMKWSIALGNVTEAGGGMVNCATVEGARILEKDDSGEATTSAASPKNILSAAFLVVAAASVFA